MVRLLFKIVLKEDSEVLDEVVVVGYGTQKKVNLTGAVTMADGDVLEDRPIANVTQGLQGAIPNLNITFDGGSPNATAQINVRGTTSLNGGSALILVDGVETNDISLLNPQDIASISVLKDASSAAVYGARAAFGVVLITTKKGTKGEKVRVNYNNNFSWSSLPDCPEGINSSKWIHAINQASVNSGGNGDFSTELVEAIDRYNSDPVNNPSVFIDQTGKYTGIGQWRMLLIQTGSRSSIRNLLSCSNIMPVSAEELRKIHIMLLSDTKDKMDYLHLEMILINVSICLSILLLN